MDRPHAIEDPADAASRGLSLQCAGRAAEAVAALRVATAGLPARWPAVWLALARAHRDLRQWTQVADCVRRGLELRPAWPEAAWLGLFAAGRLEDPLLAGEVAVSLGPL